MKKLSLILLGLLPACWMASQAPGQLTKLSAIVNFDGMPDEDFWDDIDPLPLVMNLPIYGSEPTQNTEIRVAYDDNYLYGAFRLYEKDASKISRNSYRRDALIANTDWVALIIDSYNDKETALAFLTNPNGLRFDANVFNDGLGELPFNIDWNTFWDVKTTTNEEGWFVEMRIPFTSLQFQSGEEVTMGIIAWRYIARNNESDVFPDIPPDFGDWSTWRPSLSQEFTLKNVQNKRPFYVAPYVRTGFSESSLLNDAETAYPYENDRDLEPGLDVKYGISKSFTLDLTVNTDFAQVEADDQQINLERSALFFPEKRLFFQERAGIFNFNFGSRDQLFYSRRIGLDEDGRPVRMLGGARVVGRAGKWDMGFLNMQTAQSDDLNAENFTVLRARRQVVNQNSDAGFFFGNRMDFDGNFNTSYGLDASIRFSDKNDQLDLRWAQTFDSENSDQLLSLAPTRFWISLVRRQFTGFTYGTSFSRAGEHYDPGIGFQGREDFTRWGQRLTYGWFAPGDSPVQTFNAVYRAQMLWANDQTGRLLTYSPSLSFEIVWKSQWRLTPGIRYNREYLEEELEFTDDVAIPVGGYDFIQPNIMFSTPFTKPFSVMGQASFGSFYDGQRTNISLTPTWAISSNLEISGTYEYNRLNFDSRGELVNLHIARLKALVMFDTKWSINSFIQYNSSDKNFGANIRLRFNPMEGNDLFIVFNDDMNFDRYREWPTLPKHNVRSFIVKYTYTFRL
jgi:hypothetical protein